MVGWGLDFSPLKMNTFEGKGKLSLRLLILQWGENTNKPKTIEKYTFKENYAYLDFQELNFSLKAGNSLIGAGPYCFTKELNDC